MLNIKKILKKKGVTSAELADKLGVSQPSISYAINGNPTLETLQKIADALDVQIVDLFERDSDKLNAIIVHNNKHYEASTVAELEKIIAELKTE